MKPFFRFFTVFLKKYNIQAFYKQRLFNLTSVLLNFFMNWASNVASVLLNTYNHHYTETFYI